MPVSQEHLEKKLKEALEPTYLRVEDFSDGCGWKYNVVVVSSKFDGLSLLARQRLVNETLADEMKEIHALTQKCMTPAQFETLQKENPDLIKTATATAAADSKCINKH